MANKSIQFDLGLRCFDYITSQTVTITNCEVGAYIITFGASNYPNACTYTGVGSLTNVIYTQQNGLNKMSIVYAQITSSTVTIRNDNSMYVYFLVTSTPPSSVIYRSSGTKTITFDSAKSYIILDRNDRSALLPNTYEESYYNSNYYKYYYEVGAISGGYQFPGASQICPVFIFDSNAYVFPPTLVGISIASQPTKVNYYTGETFDPSGLAINAIYSDSTTQNVPSNEYSLSTPNMSTAGQKTITVSYQGFTTSFNINVTALVVTSLTLSGSYPTEFNLNDTFSYSGLVVTANYNNGGSLTTNNYSVTGPNMSTAGQQTVTVNYTGSDVSSAVSASYTITIKAPSGIKYFDGTDWVDCEVYYCDSTGFSCQQVDSATYTGTDSTYSYYIPNDVTEDGEYIFYLGSDSLGGSRGIQSYPNGSDAHHALNSSIYATALGNADSSFNSYSYKYIVVYNYNSSVDKSIPIIMTINTPVSTYTVSPTYKTDYGLEFIKCEAKYYNGTGFVPLN